MNKKIETILKKLKIEDTKILIFNFSFFIVTILLSIRVEQGIGMTIMLALIYLTVLTYKPRLKFVYMLIFVFLNMVLILLFRMIFYYTLVSNMNAPNIKIYVYILIFGLSILLAYLTQKMSDFLRNSPYRLEK